ncbi:hypothetical protein PCANC_04150 [Puccinia coronata f. sp. avenae]|uniref:Uncharacterized protein n=1 Tax=Puccinia coronata f. sp. avenae TaxID=200324 RepID=A0A2N5W771_9BASI|nr:hypothetical protein PCANC_04150 [Puccinia coronata f. sp. avenae]
MTTSYPSDIDFRLVHVSHKTKVAKCVSTSLSLLEETDQRPLCLHTLPPLGTPIEEIEKTIALSKSNPDKNAVGRLISIVEIIKRDFIGDGNDRARKRQKTESHISTRASSSPLHQYNEYGSLESLILERSKGCEISQSEKQARSLAHQTKVMQEFLHEERKRPRQSHTPWLKIYLWPSEIPSLQNRMNVSYQEPSIPRNLTSDALPLTNDPLPPASSGLPPLESTLVKPQEDILEEEFDLAPI